MLLRNNGSSFVLYLAYVKTSFYYWSCGAVQEVKEKEQVLVAKTLEDQIKFGKNVYNQNCAACHQPDGKGVPGAFPPLAGSDFLKNNDTKKIIGVVKNGLTGAIKVNGEKYDGVMPSLGLSDEDIANVLTYVYHSWGNSKKTISPQQVKAIKAEQKEVKGE
jgi:nitrite reductase (NO-forming)